MGDQGMELPGVQPRLHKDHKTDEVDPFSNLLIHVAAYRCPTPHFHHAFFHRPHLKHQTGKSHPNCVAWDWINRWIADTLIPFQDCTFESLDVFVIYPVRYEGKPKTGTPHEDHSFSTHTISTLLSIVILQSVLAKDRYRRHLHLLLRVNQRAFQCGCLLS